MKVRVGLTRQLSFITDIKNFYQSGAKVNGLPLGITAMTNSGSLDFYLMSRYFDREKKKFIIHKSKIPYYEYHAKFTNKMKSELVTTGTLIDFFNNEW
jgi:uncharacterized membrane-anchored protein